MLTLGTRGRAHRGASLVELLVALALFGVIGLATLRSLDRQARFHSGILAILESRAQHAAAHEAVATELRSVSTAAADIARLADSAVVFRLPVGSAVVCRFTAGVIDLVPDRVASGQVFAATRSAPQAGDTAWVLDEGASDLAADDVWIGLRVLATSRLPDRCVGTPFVDPVLDAGLLSWRLVVVTLPSDTVHAGAPLRLTRMARLALYRGGTGEYALGYAEVHPSSGAWVAIQPVSGPYVPYSAVLPATSGFTFAGKDSSGAGSTSLGMGTPAAIAIASRTQTVRAVRMDGIARGRYTDSLISLIALRNAR